MYESRGSNLRFHGVFRFLTLVVPSTAPHQAGASRCDVDAVRVETPMLMKTDFSPKLINYFSGNFCHYTDYFITVLTCDGKIHKNSNHFRPKNETNYFVNLYLNFPTVLKKVCFFI